MNANFYYIVRCAYKLLLKGKVSDAIVLLGHLVKHIEEAEDQRDIIKNAETHVGESYAH